MRQPLLRISENAGCRGTNVDYLVELKDGQDLVATSTRREPGLEPGRPASIGFSTEDVVPLVPD